MAYPMIHHSPSVRIASTLSLLLFLGCAKGKGERCELDGDCDKGLMCITLKEISLERTCVSQEDADAACAKGDDCERVGWCGFDTKVKMCQPTKPEHCKNTRACKGRGECTLVRGRCEKGDE